MLQITNIAINQYTYIYIYVYHDEMQDEIYQMNGGK